MVVFNDHKNTQDEYFEKKNLKHEAQNKNLSNIINQK